MVDGVISGSRPNFLHAHIQIGVKVQWSERVNTLILTLINFCRYVFRKRERRATWLWCHTYPFRWAFIVVVVDAIYFILFFFFLCLFVCLFACFLPRSLLRPLRFPPLSLLRLCLSLSRVSRSLVLVSFPFCIWWGVFTWIGDVKNGSLMIAAEAHSSYSSSCSNKKRYSAQKYVQSV